MKSALIPLCTIPRLAVALCVGGSVLFGSSLFAARTSADYSIPVESTDSAGLNTQSADYSVEGNAVGEFGAGASAVLTSTDYTGKNGYVGGLYDLVSLSITASSTNLNETASRQLNAAPQADDGTTLGALNSATVSWSVVSGPLASISSTGLATAGNVFQDTSATAGGSAQALNGQLVLNIINVGFDDFAEYAGDQIDDDWQVQYFGLPPNPNAGPTADPDGDGQDNRFEFTAGLIPNDQTSRFALKIQKVAGQPGQRAILFSPLALPGRTYTVQFTPLLISPSSWTTLTGTTQSDNGNERTVTDLNASSSPKYYRVQITKP